MSAQNWTCSYCDRTQIATNSNRAVLQNHLPLGDPHNVIGGRIYASRCLNSACNNVTVDVWIGPWRDAGTTISRPDLTESALFRRRILPGGAAKPQPDFIPQAIRDDYFEACLIRDLSPKASATLARRCLQGMIRDFAKPKTKSDKLFEEIKALEAAIADGTAPREISAASVDAMTAVRKVGNIGAHMEADVDVIVDVDAGEAQVLINLIEALLQDWYVEREKRKSLFGATIALAAEKKQQLTEARANQAALPSPSATESDDKPVA